MRRFRRDTGQATVEFAILFAAVIAPLTFAIAYTAQMLWVWHSVVEFTRDGARYAATHCWQPGGDNVLTYMRSNVPRMIDMDQFAGGAAEIQIEYSSRDADTGQLVEFACNSGECSTGCIPDAVSVQIVNYEFRRFVGFLGLPPVGIPTFKTSAPMESAGCDPEQGVCLP
jgi:hypothetical protein